jgi:hypothetical protein
LLGNKTGFPVQKKISKIRLFRLRNEEIIIEKPLRGALPSITPPISVNACAM